MVFIRGCPERGGRVVLEERERGGGGGEGGSERVGKNDTSFHQISTLPSGFYVSMLYVNLVKSNHSIAH